MISSSYAAIHSFFDCYGMVHARSLLAKTIKTADSEKIWKGRYPADVLYFTGHLVQLAKAAFDIMERYDYLQEAIIGEEDTNPYWMLQQYESYCGWHMNATPWDFFPRHLSQKEFLDPYKALEKFTRYRSFSRWKAAIKELREHALSPNSIAEFEDGTGLLGTWIMLHKLIEACHLLEVRSAEEKQRRFKWKDRDALLAGKNPHSENNQAEQ